MLSYFITEIVEDEKICDWSVLTERINLVDLRNIKERPGLIQLSMILNTENNRWNSRYCSNDIFRK